MLTIVTQVLLWEDDKDLEVKNFRKKEKNALKIQAPNGSKEKKGT